MPALAAILRASRPFRRHRLRLSLKRGLGAALANGPLSLGARRAAHVSVVARQAWNTAKVLVNGRLIATPSTFDVENPTTGEVVGAAPHATEDLLVGAVEAAHRSQKVWGELPHQRRATALAECASAIRARAQELSELLTQESGRPLSESRVEVAVAAAMFEAAAQSLDIDSQEEAVREDDDKRIVLRRLPLGVVCIIAPWNAPIILGWKPTAVALACGNCVVLKPSPQTPLTTLRIAELLQGKLLPGVLNVVTGRDGVPGEQRPGEVLSNHPLVRKVVFTGSVEVGRKVMAACADKLTRILLELGGNDAAIVLEDCDIPSTVDGVFEAAFFNNGQTCCAIKRLYVHESIFEPFVKALVRRARAARIGDALNTDVELGPLASADQLARITEYVEDARRNGGRVLCGGRPLGSQGYFYPPTIVIGVQEGVRLVDEEQFGPVLPVMPFNDVSSAIYRANSTSFGLGASIWSTDIHRANQLARYLRAGVVWVNRHDLGSVRGAPFGGFNLSGFGRTGDLGQCDFSEFTELMTLILGKVPDLASKKHGEAKEAHVDDAIASVEAAASRNVARQLFDRFDKNGDGQINFDEFQELLKEAKLGLDLDVASR